MEKEQQHMHKFHVIEICCAIHGKHLEAKTPQAEHKNPLMTCGLCTKESGKKRRLQPEDWRLIRELRARNKEHAEKVLHDEIHNFL